MSERYLKNIQFLLLTIFLVSLLKGCAPSTESYILNDLRKDLRAIHETLKQQSTSHPKQDPS